MPFMQPVVEAGEWIEVETRNGTTWLPADIVPQTVLDHCRGLVDELTDADNPCSTVRCDLLEFLEDTFDANDILSVSARTGYGARLSAPGYMDCTSWTVFDSEQEAREYLADTYPEDDADEDEDYLD